MLFPLPKSPIAGYRSVLRTFISAFVASYEITHQIEDSTFNQILDIVCKIYSGEEALCVQFWDRESFVDGPIRCLLCSLESEFPFRTVELVRLLSALCEGAWPAECVYNFLDKMVGITSLFEIPGDSSVDNSSQIVETLYPLRIPRVDGLIIPTRTRGHVLKVVEGNIALIRWQYMQSGMFVLVLRLARELHLNSYEDVLATLDLLCRLVSFNTALCFALIHIDNSLSVQAARMNGHINENLSVDVVKIICTLVSKLAPSVNSVAVMSMCISILSKMLKCLPSHVAAVASTANVFGTGSRDLSSGTWLLSGGLARMLLVDCEQNEDCCSLTISVLDFTMQLVETGVEDSMVSALVVFCLQYVLVNHEHWKYKVKHSRWKVTIKVLEVVKSCIKSVQHSQKHGYLIRDILLCDSSIHNTLFRIMCIKAQTFERLYLSRLYELKEIEGLQLSVNSALDIVFSILVNLSKDFPSGLPVFHQAVLSSTTKPIPVSTAVVALMSFSRNPAIQVAAARLLSLLCIIAEKAQPHSFGSVCLMSDDMQIRELSSSIRDILSEEPITHEDLFISFLKFLISAAQYQPAFLISMIATKENGEVQQSDAGNAKYQLLDVPSFESLKSKKASIMGSLLQYVKRSNELIESHPSLLLNVLNFLKTLWQGATQYMQMLETFKNSEEFWKNLSSSVSLIASKGASSLENQTGDETLHLAYRYQCQSAVLEIMAHEMFLQKKLFNEELLEKSTSEQCRGKIERTVNIDKSKFDNVSGLKDILSTWCERSVMDNLVKSCVPCGYDKEVILRLKIAANLCIVHLMQKLSFGDTGSLSISLVKKIHDISKKLNEQPAFSELLAQYSLHGYSEGKQLNALILNDLYYHLQGEMEGREITPGPFRDLSQYLFGLEILYTNERKHMMDFYPPDSDTYLFDHRHLRASLGIEFWDHSDWKASKAVAESMLLHMYNANMMLFLADSKHSALKALIAILSVYEGNFTETTAASRGEGIGESLIKSCIDYVCECLQTIIESIVPTPYPSEDLLKFLTTQAQLLLNLIRFLYRRVSVRTNRQHFLRVCALVINTSGSGLRVLCDIRPSTVGLKKTVKLFLTLLLTSLEFSCLQAQEKPNLDGVDTFAEVSLVILGLLPVLCNCIETDEYLNLTLAAIDIILKAFLASNTWLPVLQKHLHLQLVIKKLPEKDSLVSVPIILKFLLTLSRNRGGAQMLQSSNIFSSLKVLFALFLDGKDFPNDQDEMYLSPTFNKDEKPQHIWGLCLAIIISMINSLRDDSSCGDLVDSAISYFFLEKAYLISYYLSAPEFLTDEHSKKRAQTQNTQTSLTSLRDTEHTLMLICTLAEHRHSWSKFMKEMDSQLRERSIHLLAFISRGTQRIGESPNRNTPLLCPPILKEEVESYEREPFVNSKNGWFVLLALGCEAKTTASPRDGANENPDAIRWTHFSDSAAIQLYRIGFFLLKFLCLQAKSATERAEELGFINLAHFPELPMPEILHGLQDQAIAIVTELCEARKLEQGRSESSEIYALCFLLLKIIEKALYLELCVQQTCGIRPVLGRVEDFSKEIKSLIQATEKCTYLKPSLQSLKQIIALLYPGLLQTEGIM
ncbi:nucleoporin (DUF3414) isoform X2 [Tasmannia lanceolata]|uniref:nucleoporin (DUF3414) isoform X2 n=1 Tax=Tasmannia lanceolata TaxID=3420 RepID=UPI004062DF25